MVKDYLNQTAVLKVTDGYDKYGDPKIIETKTIAVRWEGKRRLVRDKSGKEVVSEAYFFCLEKAKPDDIVEFDGEWTVIGASPKVDLDGNLSHYEVSV